MSPGPDGCQRAIPRVRRGPGFAPELAPRRKWNLVILFPDVNGVPHLEG